MYQCCSCCPLVIFCSSSRGSSPVVITVLLHGRSPITLTCPKKVRLHVIYWRRQNSFAFIVRRENYLIDLHRSAHSLYRRPDGCKRGSSREELSRERKFISCYFWLQLNHKTCFKYRIHQRQMSLECTQSYILRLISNSHMTGIEDRRKKNWFQTWCHPKVVSVKN